MTADRQLQERVLSALDFEPSVDAARIGVSVDHGVVTLTGSVKTFHEKWEAARIVRATYGVRALANDLAVSPDGAMERSDPAIAEAAANALAWNAALPFNAVKATVTSGYVTLTGKVDWQYQRAVAERAVRNLYGVKGVTDLVELRSHANAGDVRVNIENAFKRSAEVDAQRVSVETRDGEVILTGTVRSLVERAAAERAAWAAAGVKKVDDRLVVAP
jgi:osmotically-inducible protein OsmY